MDFEAFWIGRNYQSLQGLLSRIGEPSTMERFRLWYMKSMSPFILVNKSTVCGLLYQLNNWAFDQQQNYIRVLCLHAKTIEM